ncbi:MAG: hypothetical protein IKN31_04160 [Bacteroidales bacterium]|nr:hypothetical protein [Bacteroidales bacterium]
MKKYLLILVCLVYSYFAVAQESKFQQRLEVVTVSIQEGDDDSMMSAREDMGVFNIPIDGENHYYLSVGHLGIGDDIIQFNVDPLFELFIPIGDTLAESMDSLKELQSLFKGPKGGSIETEGCLAFAFPNENLEKVTVTYQKVLLTKMLAFSVEREGYVRSTHIPRSQINSLISSLKLYRKLHPKEI